MNLSPEELQLIKRFRAEQDAKIGKYVKNKVVDQDGNPTGLVAVEAKELADLVEAADKWKVHNCSGQEA